MRTGKTLKGGGGGGITTELASRQLLSLIIQNGGSASLFCKAPVKIFNFVDQSLSQVHTFDSCYRAKAARCNAYIAEQARLGSSKTFIKTSVGQDVAR